MLTDVPESVRNNQTAFARVKAQQLRMCAGKITSRGQCRKMGAEVSALDLGITWSHFPTEEYRMLVSGH